MDEDKDLRADQEDAIEESVKEGLIDEADAEWLRARNEERLYWELVKHLE